MWLFKQYLNGPAEAAVKSCVALPIPVKDGHESSLQIYSDGPVPSKQYAIDDDIANSDNGVQSLRHE